MTLVVSKPPPYFFVIFAVPVDFHLHIWYNNYMDKELIITSKTCVTHGRGYVYLLQYHIVWVTKYRKPILTGDIAADIKRHLLTTMNELQMDCLAMEVMPDHIHLLVSCKPQLRLSDAIKVLKGNTARWLFMGHPELKKSLWGGHLWNPSYFVVTVSERSTAQMEAYIQSQERRVSHGGDRNQS